MYPSTIPIDIPALNEHVKSGIIYAGATIDSDSDLGIELQVISQTVASPINWIVESIRTSRDYINLQFGDWFYETSASNGLELYLFCYTSNYRISVGLISDGIRCLKLKYVDLESWVSAKS